MNEKFSFEIFLAIYAYKYSSVVVKTCCGCKLQTIDLISWISNFHGFVIFFFFLFLQKAKHFRNPQIRNSLVDFLFLFMFLLFLFFCFRKHLNFEYTNLWWIRERKLLMENLKDIPQLRRKREREEKL